MPRNKNASKVKTPPMSPTPPEDQETENVSTDTTSDQTVNVDADDDYDNDEYAQYDVSWEFAPDDYSPNRRTPGRIRRPSAYDDVLRRDDVYNKGYIRVPVTSEDHKAFVKREIDRSKLYLNSLAQENGEPEIGISFDLGDEDAIYFRSRLAQKRKRKSLTDGDDDTVDTEEDNNDESESDHSDLDN